MKWMEKGVQSSSHNSFTHCSNLSQLLDDKYGTEHRYYKFKMDDIESYID